MAVACLFRPFLLLSSFFAVLPLTSSVSDSEALSKLKKSFTNASSLDSWVPAGSAPCNEQGTNWDYVLCYKDVVTGLRLEGLGLSGKVDVDALVEMKDLRSFSVMNNSFTGIIPEINRLGSLKALFLSGNQFSGEIPADYFANMGSLKKVWLSNNKFTGNIPFSLGKLSNLIELHLENNEFSGHIPGFNSPTLKSIDLSNNKLEGEIPSSLSKFKANAFTGNQLCGEQVGVACNKAADGSPETTSSEPAASHNGEIREPNKKIIAALVTLGVMLLSVVLFCAIRWRRKKKQEDANVLGRRSPNEAAAVEVQVPIPAAARSRELEVTRKTNSRGSRGKGGGTVPELVIVNDEKGVFALPDLMKAAAELLGNGSLGSSYKASMANGMAVVAKRMREMNALSKEAFDADIKRLGKLRHPNVLTPLAYHYRRDEKLFVYEYLPNGSLLYLLHGDRGISSRAELDWPNRLKIVQGIAKGLDYLHAELASLDVPHGNLKSSNVLLGPDNHPLLSDYGFWPFLNPEGARSLFAYKTPEAIQHGIVSHKSDVYCLGIVILEILTGKFPSQYLNDGNGTDALQWVAYAFSEGRQVELLDPEISGCQNSLGSMEKLLQIGCLCTQSSPEQRLEMKEAVRMIEDVQEEGCLEPHSQVRTMEVLPSLPDGYAEPHSEVRTIEVLPSLRDGHAESHSQVGTVEVLPSLREGYADAPNSNSQSSSFREENIAEQVTRRVESEISEERSEPRRADNFAFAVS